LVLKFTWPALPFMDRVGVVFLACMAIAVVLSLMQPPREAVLKVDLKNIDYSTSAGFNFAALIITLILIALYTIWW
jgi:solute:Na+ symporter, SSS family